MAVFYGRISDDGDESHDLFNQLKTIIFMAVNGYDELQGSVWTLLEDEAAEVVSLTKDEKKQYDQRT